MLHRQPFRLYLFQTPNCPLLEEGISRDVRLARYLRRTAYRMVLLQVGLPSRGSVEARSALTHDIISCHPTRKGSRRNADVMLECSLKLLGGRAHDVPGGRTMGD